MKLNVRADLEQLPTYESNIHYAEIIVDANESPANLPDVVLEKINKLIITTKILLIKYSKRKLKKTIFVTWHKRKLYLH